jgi:hypothetical protein
VTDCSLLYLLLLFALEICSDWEVGVSQTVQVVAGLHERGIDTGHAMCREGIAESCEGFKSCTCYVNCELIIKAAWVQ